MIRNKIVWAFVVKPVKNSLKRMEYYSYRLAPYLAFKGSKSVQEIEIFYWMMDMTRDYVANLNEKECSDFPVRPISHDYC